MRLRILILINIIMLCTQLLNSQIRDPYQHKFYLNDSIYLNASDPNFTIDRFHLGWHWADGKKMTSALKMTSSHSNSGLNYERLADSVDVILNVNDVTANGVSLAPLNSMMMVFEPTLKIHNPGQFQTRDGDSTNPVFGFQYIHPSIEINASDRELKLYKNSGYGTPQNPELVLDEPWSKSELKFIQDMKKNSNNDTLEHFDGTDWYFTINIRRNEIIDVIDDLTVLSIRLPFSAVQKDKTSLGKDTLIKTNGYIKFLQIPNDNHYSYYKEYDLYRGVYRELESGNNTTELLIKRKHILKSSDSIITICAKFTCNFLRDPNSNYDLIYFHNDQKSFDYFIDSIGIEIKYHGTLDIAIGKIKFETPNAQKLNRGGFDNSIISNIQNSINTFQDTALINRGIRLVRFYTRDEGGLAFWGATRYFNKLVGNLGTFEGNPHYPELYNHYANPPEMWYCPWGFKSASPVPFIKGSSGHDGTLEYAGYKYSYNYNDFKDTLLSDYETFIWPENVGISQIKNSSLNDYLQYLSKFSSVQSEIEKTIYKHFVDVSSNSYLYDDLKWWSQFQVLAEWSLHKIDNNWQIKISNTRPHTGEEIRFGAFYGILMGAKGLVYDGEYSNDIAGDLQNALENDANAIKVERIMTRIGHGQNYYSENGYENLNNDVFINLEDIGSDYVDLDGDSTNINLFISNDVMTNLKLNDDRFYLGRKSMRLEMLNLHNWVKLNESVLLNLKLVAWFGYGYKDFYHQDPGYASDSVLKRYVDIDNSKSKKLFDVNSVGGYSIQTTHENIDSCFFDIALHLNTNDDNQSGIKFYLGIQNRRLDPLIFCTDLNDTNKKYLKFLSTAEFGKLCLEGGTDPEYSGIFLPNTHWQSYFWKRFGVRELSIPMAFQKVIYNNGLMSITAKEIGVDNYDDLGVWYSEPYYHRIDTIIPLNGTLVSKHLPGQGKMIECKFNSVFDNSESPCDICDFVNNFDDFNISLAPTQKQGTNCCYELQFINHSDCSSGIIPVKLMSNSGEPISFGNTPFTEDEGLKTLSTDYDISNTGIYTIGELCVGESNDPVEFEVVFGSDIEGEFYGCNRKFKFVINCQEDTVEAENCCDMFYVNSTYYPLPAPPAQRISCCSDVKINNYAVNNCIKSISLDRYGTGNYTEFDSTIVEPLFATVGTQSLTEICNPIANCLPGSNTLFTIDRDIIFRGVDGEIICTKKVPIFYCCDIIQGPGGTEKRAPSDESQDLIEDSRFHLEILPNPNDGIAKLRINSQAEANGKIKIISSTGETLKEFHNITVKSNVEEIDLNLSDLSSGAYYLIFETELGVKSIQIIKLK